MQRIIVRLPDQVAHDLMELASRDLRPTRDQATVLLIDAVRRASRRMPADRPREPVR